MAPIRETQRAAAIRSRSVGEFVTGVMRIVLLMSGNFTPYWKWLAFEFRKRPGVQSYVPLLDELVSIVHWFSDNFWMADG